MTPLETLRLYPSHDGTLCGSVASCVSVKPDAPFLLESNRALTWREFMHATERAAGALAALGVQAGDRVASVSANRIEVVVLFFAAARLGAWFVPVNPDLKIEEMRYILEHAGVRGVACSRDALASARAATESITPRPWMLLLEDEAAEGVETFAAHLARATPITGNRAHADDTCLVLYTSGTTGFPKGVMHRQRSVVMAGEGFVERLHLQPDDRLLAILPLFHINALFYSLAGTLAAGASLALMPRFSASRFWHTAAELGATEVNIIAAVGNILARRPRSEFVPHSIRKVYGAPVSAEIERVFREEFGVPVILEGYGMTEIPGVCNNPFPGSGHGENRIGSMGRAARHPDPSVAFAEMRVIDDEGNPLPDGETGELAVKTPIIMQGYYRDPEATAAAFRDGWFLTGDLVRRDADGYFWFVARKKDIIRRRGENISGAELDRIIGAHPDVAEAAAIAVPAELGEDEILVAIVPKAGMKPDANAIADWCRARLAAHKQPRYVVFVESLPHTPTLRVAKFKLKGDATLVARAIDLASTRSSSPG